MYSFARELCIWESLMHMNILALIGVAVIDGMPVLASEWMENGTMNDYLKKQSGIVITALVRATNVF